MRRTTLTIVNPLGLHARAASKLVDVAKNFAANITLTSDSGVEADAKRIMSLLLLGAPVDSQVALSVEGEEEDDAFDALTALIRAGFKVAVDLFSCTPSQSIVDAALVIGSSCLKAEPCNNRDALSATVTRA